MHPPPRSSLFTNSLQGLDWHGPSAKEALGTVPALSRILQIRDDWKKLAFSEDAKVILIGHSNGGQGTWHLASHFPDRVIACEFFNCIQPVHNFVQSDRSGCSGTSRSLYQVPSICSANAIEVCPLVLLVKARKSNSLNLRSAHYVDPILRSILESSLTPDDNDLHLSNIATLPILAVHG